MLKLVLTFMFFYFLEFILNSPSPIHINSFSPYFLTTNEALFEFEYDSSEKSDIICNFYPYPNEIIYGEITLYKNDTYEKFKEKFIFNEESHITINTKSIYNKGKGIYYINLEGNLQCKFEIFLLNEIRNIEINNSYLFMNYFGCESQNYYSMKINNFNSNIYMNILLLNNSCSAFNITKNNQIMKCNQEISNLFLLETNNEYRIDFNLNIYNFLVVNFIDLDLIKSLDDNHKSNSFHILIDTMYNFSIAIKNYKKNEYFGFILDVPIEFSLSGNFKEQKNMENFNESMGYSGYNFFITQKLNDNDNYFLFKMNFNSEYLDKINIIKLDEIIFINEIPFSYDIKKEKNYLFSFDKKLINYLINFYSNIEINYSHENNMNIILKNTINKIYRDKYFITKLDSIDCIYFINVAQDGIFEIKMLSKNYNDIIDLNYINYKEENLFLFNNYINQKINFLSKNNKRIIFCNLIVGDVDFYQLSDLNEKNNEVKLEQEIKQIKNETLLIKSVMNSYSIYEIFVQNSERDFNFLGINSKMIYFSKYINYRIYIQNSGKYAVKLLNSDNTELTILTNETKIILDKINPFIELENITKINLEGNNSLVYFLVPVINSDYDYVISNATKMSLNVSQVFVIPEETNYDVINLIITIDESDEDEDEVILLYLIDCNIIPYSRNKLDLLKTTTLKKGIKNFVVINNYLKNNKALKSHNNETFYIFLSFNSNISFTYELKYSNYQMLLQNEQNLIEKGNKKIYIGNKNNNFIKFEKCGTKDISLNIYQNEEIKQKDITISENNYFLPCTKTDEEEGFLSLEVNSEENFLISIAHDNITSFNNLIYNYDIELSLDEKNKKIIVNYYSISNFPQIEYHIFILNKTYYDNLTNHCFINKNINDIFLKKYMFMSNGEEEIFNNYLDINTKDGIIKCNETYSILILGKEIINDFINYHYYNPKNILINVNMCNDYDLSANQIDVTSLFILGFDKYFDDINNKITKFNCYFIENEEILYPKILYLNLSINYKNNKNRNLQIKDNEIKSKCELNINNEIKNQIKYGCEFDTNGEEISNVIILDKFEKSSFIYLFYKDNIQSAKDEIFNKTLYILQDATITTSKKEFNITGDLYNAQKQLENKDKIILEFYADKDKNEIKNVTCNIINENKVILRCIPEKKFNSNIINGYSNLKNGHLFVIFKNSENQIEIEEPEIFNNTYNKKNSDGLSTGAIIGIVIAVVCVLVAGAVVAVVFLKKKNKKVPNSQNESVCNLEKK